jgi:hypothetical protein
MITVLFILWDSLFVLAGWYLHRHPLLFENVRHEQWQMRINKVIGIALMIVGGIFAVARVVFSFIKM